MDYEKSVCPYDALIKEETNTIEVKEVIKTKRRCPSCGNYLENSSDCDFCGWPYHVPSWGVNPGTGMFDKTKNE